MKLFLSLIFFISALIPVSSYGHGGVSNQSGDYIVFLNQQPLSPLVGEEVKFSFALKDKLFEALPGRVVEVDVIENKDEDPANDVKINSQEFVTDVNGSFAFAYTFPKESYYDVEISILDPAAEPTLVGFLVQTRKVQTDILVLSGLILVGLVAVSTLIFQKNKIK